jgi:transcriptional regulator with XRE-family HTH domain
MSQGQDERTLRTLVGKRLRMRRIWLELSQDEVAAKAGVTRNFVSAIERAAQGLDAFRLGRVAEALDVSLTWLLDGPNDQVTSPTSGGQPSGRAEEAPDRSDL